MTNIAAGIPASIMATRRPEPQVFLTFHEVSTQFRFALELEAAMTIEQTRDQIVDQFSSVLSEAESLLSKATKETGDKARDLRSQAEARLLSAKLKLQELQGEAVDRAKDAARATDAYVHDNPWQAIGIAAAVGFVAGLLMNRR